MTPPIPLTPPIVVPAVPSLASVIQKIDRLDGQEDGMLVERFPLDVASTAGACQIQQVLQRAIEEERPSVRGEMVTRFIDPNGKSTILDCVAVTRRLDQLVGLAGKLPVQRFLTVLQPDKRSDQAELPKVTQEELFGFLMLATMLGVALTGEVAPDVPLHESFAALPFQVFVDMTAEYAEPLDTPVTLPAGVTVTVPQAYAILQKLGAQYDFDPAPLAPPKPSKESL